MAEVFGVKAGCRVQGAREMKERRGEWEKKRKTPFNTVKNSVTPSKKKSKTKDKRQE